MSSLFEVTALDWDTPHPSRGSTAGADELFTLTVADVVTATFQSTLGLGQSASSMVGGFLARLRGHRTPLQNCAWIERLVAEHGYQQVIDKAKLQAKNGLFPDDHLFKNMTNNGMMADNIVLFKSGSTLAHQVADGHSCEVVAVYLMGHGVCGHAGIVHGGMTSALIDETCGYLLYLARSQGVLNFKAVLTASLEVGFKQPLTPDQPVVITAYISEVQGRKIWVEVQVTDLPGCMTSSTSPASSTGSLREGGDVTAPVQKLYATGKALFIIPRADSDSTAKLEQAGKGSTLLGRKRLAKDEGYPADV